jgi:hypothetical protein
MAVKSGLAKREEITELATPGGHVDGFFDEDRHDTIPVAYLLQDGSPEVKKKVKGAEPGILWFRVAQQPLPEEFVPVLFYNEVIKWVDPDEGGGIEWRSRKFTDPEVQEALLWKEDKKGKRIPPMATEYVNCIALFPGIASPIIIGFSKTLYPEGDAFYKMAKAKRVSPWFNKYKWVSYVKENERYMWHGIRIEHVGETTEDERTISKDLSDLISPRLREGSLNATHEQPLPSTVKDEKDGDEDLPPHLR